MNKFSSLAVHLGICIL